MLTHVITDEDGTQKVENENGEIAVLVSPGFGSGWSTWNEGQNLFEPKIVEMVLSGNEDDIDEEWCLKNLGKELYCGGASQLEIEWVKKGLRFSINEYDGSESLYIEDQLEFKA